MNEQGTTFFTGQFKSLNHEGQHTNVYSFMTKHNGLIEVGVNKSIIVPELNKDYEVEVRIVGRQCLTKSGYYIIDNRLTVIATNESDSIGA